MAVRGVSERIPMSENRKLMGADHTLIVILIAKNIARNSAEAA